METYKLIVHTIQIWKRINNTVHTIQIWKRINLLYTQYVCTHNTYKLIVHTIRINVKYCTHNTDMETYKLIVHTIQIWKRINLLYTQYV